MWSSHPDFSSVVKEAGLKPVQTFSTPLIALSRKLKNVKEALKIWNTNIFGNISSLTTDCKNRLSSIQACLQIDHLNSSLTEGEKAETAILSSLLAQEESFLRQKARINWFKLGDSNSSYFHRSLKARNNFNSITMLASPHGTHVSKVDETKEVATNHFNNLFNPVASLVLHIPEGLINKLVPNDVVPTVWAIPSDEEITAAIKSHKSSKAPGPDGFSMGFFDST
ncbi:uncharacterized protein LOC122069553 [Macadamia integrifolia]|uniref:uncharacterized protein LOC122069553 n=1 Tax=Macadamia integrifolia TaxID=60698 RepID=UPI001C4E5457|nr:uncharacterized protein LOC122069553 [Macadamia integrifolia]